MSLFARHYTMSTKDGLLWTEVSERQGDVEAITEDEKNTIDAVLSFYGEKEPSWLSGLTHQEKPWLEARGNCPPGFPCATTISKDTMQQYYASLIDG